MRIQVLSDLHFEFHRDGGAAFVRGLDPSGVDAPVVAGDLATRRLLRDALADRGPALWVHGHSHAPADCRIRATRVVCNPLGYPREHGVSFQERFVVDVLPP